jgi:hypothetical protein
VVIKFIKNQGAILKINPLFPLVFGVITTFIWAALMIMSIAFVIYEQPLSLSDPDFLLLFLVKYYPFVMLILYITAVKFKDDRGLLPLASFALPTIVLSFLIFDSFRTSIVDWDEYETARDKDIIYSSAFKSVSTLESLNITKEDANLTGIGGMTPLVASYRGRKYKNFSYLLEIGANPNAIPREKFQYNIANYIIKDFEHDDTSLKYFKVLIDYGLNLDIHTRLSNLVQSAVKSNNSWYLEHLIHANVDLNRQGSGFLSPLSQAVLFAKWSNGLLLLPHSNEKSLEQAAFVYYEGNKRMGYSDPKALELKALLIESGINLEEAFNKHNTIRQNRLDSIHKNSS